MLWLIIFLLWCFRTAVIGHAAGQPAMSVLFSMLALLGVLQVIVAIIYIIQYCTFKRDGLNHNRKANPAAATLMVR
jgi:uncharacterized membrane protein YcaP (DUF421 family)